MSDAVFRMPDVGEGIAEAEIVTWLVAVGDDVERDEPMVEIMTDKATIEVGSPVTGTVTWLGGEPGDVVAVGAELIRFETEEAQHDAQPATDAGADVNRTDAQPAAAPASPAMPTDRTTSRRAIAAPAVRARALDAGVDLGLVSGTGPAGRVTHEDLDAHLTGGGAPRQVLEPNPSTTDVKIIGLRRKIAERMTLAKQRIPHITYVEEIDVTQLEALRSRLNAEPGRPKITFLPFLVRAIVQAVTAQPVVNAWFDDDAGVLHQHSAVHIGIATQTPSGLLVPVIRHAEALDLFECAAELQRLAAACRQGTVARDELTGSTITITSLGALGGLVTTPVINHPEVAIVGVNKMQVRPVWDGTTFVPRSMMNLSSGFDHRIVDGWDAATFVQRIRTLLEEPALLFIEGA